MLLADTIDRALEATEGLREALPGADPETCRTLLHERGEIMIHFEESHRRASDPERESCRQAISRLQEADRSLIEECRQELDGLARRIRDRSASSQNGHGARYNALDQQACLDRKA